jgi:hypothetical protein
MFIRAAIGMIMGNLKAGGIMAIGYIVMGLIWAVFKN